MEPLQETDRPALCRMLEESDDFPQRLLYLYRRRRSNHYWTFIAWRGDKVDGVLTGSFDSDFAEGGAFDSFELPPAPHAFLERVHVRESARAMGVGRALIEMYANEASARGCSFIGGSIDLSSEPTARKAFFEGLGFAVSGLENFGAHPTDVLVTIANR
ncbi:GNAT family N-acetyltransferase [Micromonospora sp. NBC_01638]|uniref:GNAT family N-acetyltransferase n=1 Tax=Micromonospora sp. NBC_01638 TaxID=2975982 RepID=UPI00386F481A|nr:GNAT family N-acetyltransferase [Micromonospora sp. NBC_01638]